MDSTPENLNPEHRQEIESILAEYQHQKMMESLVGPLVSMVVHVTVVVFLVFFISLDQPAAAPEVAFTMKPAEEVKEADKPEPPEPPPDLEVPLIDMQAPTTNTAPATSFTNFGDVGGAAFTIPASGSPYKVRVPAGGGGAGFGFGASGLGGGGGSSGNAFAGRFYDLKQDMMRRPASMPESRYYQILNDYVMYIAGQIPVNPLVANNVYTANRDGKIITLYSNGFYIGRCSADLGPQCYGVGDQVTTGRWFAHYQAKMRIGKDITFRFVGKGDDVLIVLVNRQLVLNGCYDTSNITAQGSRPYLKCFPQWRPTEDIKDPRVCPDPFFGGGGMPSGTWITFKKGDIATIDVIIGEIPGGIFGINLFLEERGAKYKTVTGRVASENGCADPRPVLPLFSTMEILDDRLPDNLKGGYAASRFDIKGGLLGLSSLEMFQERLGGIALKIE